VRTIDWQAFVVGLQYYLSVAQGKVWISGNFSQLKSSNIVKLTPIAGQPAVYKQAQYVDGSVFIASARPSRSATPSRWCSRLSVTT